ncbi:22213_t:CDS:2 [Entrophospora sp. SA101]|nr:22213_t:CDS:2 [Entrophospora sp. SA101]
MSGAIPASSRRAIVTIAICKISVKSRVDSPSTLRIVKLLTPIAKVANIRSFFSDSGSSIFSGAPRPSVSIRTNASTPSWSDKFFSKNNNRMKRPLVQRPTETANLHAKRAFKRVDFPDDCRPSMLTTKILSLGYALQICPQMAENQASDIDPASPSSNSMERIELEEYLKDKNNEMCEIETKQTIEDYIKLNRHSASIKLTQMLDASFIRKGISSESLDIINNRLEGILRNMPSGRRLTDYQRKKEVEEIWSLLRNNILSKYNIKPIVDQIDKEVKDACSHLSSVGFYQQYMNGNSPDLSKCDAYKKFKCFSYSSYCLELRDICTLQEKLDNLVDSILEKRASYHYYPGIVRDLTKEIDKTLNENSKILQITFLPDFKWNTYLYALLKFKPKMVNFQKQWDMDNTPLGILDQKKEEYLKMIDTRLQYGHTLVSEGHIIGDYLLRVIHKKAIDAGSFERKKAVCDIGWLTCAESVRLKYFEKLAEQVQNGDKKEAIKFFSQPKKCIEDWFKRTVDGIASGNPEQKYNDTFRAEFNRVFQEIRNCQSFEKIKKFVNDYMTQVDKMDYKLDLEDINDEDLNIFYNAIEEELETKRGGCYTRNVPFQAPSNDKSIMEILGCTEACYFCGALCWGSLGHHNDSGETKRHHTSHQPGGLARFSYRGSKELVAMPCHKLEDNVGVWYFGKEDPTPWSVVKAHDFKDWRFESHYQHLFNDLMCWFFEKLHVDLANKYGLKPSTYNEMSKYGCINLSYSDIISTLRTKI